jgi:hypothetical protein
MPTKRGWRASLIGLGTALALLSASDEIGTVANAAEPTRPVFLYSRYFNAIGETRYLPDGNYKAVLDRLRESWTVKVHSERLTPETLKGVNVVLIANPSDRAVGANPPPHHMSDADIQALTAFVRGGGGVILMENQEDHNLETEHSNRFLARFGMEAVARYTDAKPLLIRTDVPVVGGLRWAYYTGNALRLTPGHEARPRGLIMNDLAQKPVAGKRDEPGPLLAVAELGKGRVAAVTDSGWITDVALDGRGVGGVAIKEQDNWEIFSRLARWVGNVRAH